MNPRSELAPWYGSTTDSTTNRKGFGIMGKHNAPEDIFTGDGMIPVLTITNDVVAEIVAEALTVFSLRLGFLYGDEDPRVKIARAYGTIAAIQCDELRTVDVLA